MTLMELAQMVNWFGVPVLIYVVRIDRRMGQLDVLQTAYVAEQAELKKMYDNLNQRLTRLEFRQ